MNKRLAYVGTFLTGLTILGVIAFLYLDNVLVANEATLLNENRSTLTLKATHPRILLPELASWKGENIPELISSRLTAYKRNGLKVYDACKTNTIMAKTACWITTGNSNIAKKLIERLKSFSVETPQAVTNYGNAWELAFAYDYLTLYPGFDQSDRMIVEEKLVAALKHYLTILDGNSASLWHGRTTLASRAWLCAVVLDLTATREKKSILAALNHFLKSFEAVSLTEVWPEGYNYWIQSRAFEFLLATSAYLNGVDKVKHRNHVLKTIRRVGLWHIYATRPDNRIEGDGDEGSRVDLKDHTRRIIDLIGQLSKDPVFALYSRYLEELHGRQSYYKDYRWGFVLFNDPEIDLVSQKIISLKQFDTFLPKSVLFGEGATNQMYIRSGWDEDATFISYRAGHTFTHHGHYDAGHFTLFKGAPLAINSSVYGKFFSENRLNYSIRTVAKNSLLILRPGEVVRPNKFFARKNVADGGQRVTIPTGSAINSVGDWEKNLYSGSHFAGGRLIHFENSNRDYVYIASDLTDAYNTPNHDEGGSGGKVNKVTRELLYLTQDDVLVVHDYVFSTDANYKKKWLLHTVNRPQAKGVRVLKGNMDDGILETDVDQVVVSNTDSYLSLQRFYPIDARIRLVGGPDYQYYVESDGDDSDLDGENFNKGAVNKPWFDVGQWRIEIQPNTPSREDEFLIALAPSLHKQRFEALNSLNVTGDAKGLLSKSAIVLFASSTKKGKATFVAPEKQKQFLIFGLPQTIDIAMSTGGKETKLRSNSNGIIEYHLEPGVVEKNVPITIQW
jgi:hypothetical protein